MALEIVETIADLRTRVAIETLLGPARPRPDHGSAARRPRQPDPPRARRLRNGRRQHLRQPYSIRSARGSRALSAFARRGCRVVRLARRRPGVRAVGCRDVSRPAGVQGGGGKTGRPPVRAVSSRAFQRRRDSRLEAVRDRAAGQGLLRREGRAAAGRRPSAGVRLQRADRPSSACRRCASRTVWR